MHIQLLSFKIQCLSQWLRTIIVFEFKSTAGSWNVTLSCLFSTLPYHMVNCACMLCHFKREISLVGDFLFAYTTGTTSKHQRAMWLELYRKSIVFLCILVWHVSVPLLAGGYSAGSCDVSKNGAKTHFYCKFWRVLCDKHDKCDSQQKNMNRVHQVIFLWLD